MEKFTIDDLNAVLSSTLGARDEGAVTTESLDVEMADLGYDSLAVYEVVIRLQDDHSIPISDEEIEELRTPRAFITFVNGRLAEHTGS